MSDNDSLVLLLPAAPMALREIEATVLKQALMMHGWNQRKTSAYLGISPRVMSYKCKRYKLRKPRQRALFL